MHKFSVIGQKGEDWYIANSQHAKGNTNCLDKPPTFKKREYMSQGYMFLFHCVVKVNFDVWTERDENTNKQKLEAVLVPID